MLTWLAGFCWLGVGPLVCVCLGIAVRVMAKDWVMIRRVEVFGAFSNLQYWADTNGFMILFREQVWDNPYLGNGVAQVVFRVVVQDRSGQRKWARILCGTTVEVRWIKPESWFAMSPAKRDPLWDRELDA